MAAVSQTPANVRSGDGAVTDVVEAGEAFDAGQAVYLNTSDGKYYKCDADDSSKIAIKGLALTGSDASGDQFVLQSDGDCNIGGTTVKGEVYVVGNAGGIHPCSDLASNWYPIILGPATDNAGTIELICKYGSVAKA